MAFTHYSSTQARCPNIPVCVNTTKVVSSQILSVVSAIPLRLELVLSPIKNAATMVPPHPNKLTVCVMKQIYFKSLHTNLYEYSRCYCEDTTTNKYRASGRASEPHLTSDGGRGQRQNLYCRGRLSNTHWRENTKLGPPCYILAFISVL